MIGGGLLRKFDKSKADVALIVGRCCLSCCDNDPFRKTYLFHDNRLHVTKLFGPSWAKLALYWGEACLIIMHDQ